MRSSRLRGPLHLGALRDCIGSERAAEVDDGGHVVRPEVAVEKLAQEVTRAQGEARRLDGVGNNVDAPFGPIVRGDVRLSERSILLADVDRNVHRLKRGDVLLLAVLVELEIVDGESADRFTIGIGDEDVDRHGFRASPEGRGRLLNVGARDEDG